MRWLQRANGEWPAALVFFPLAVCWAGLAVPLSIIALLHPAMAPAALLPPWGHAHELLAGFALAVVFGFLVNRISGVWLLSAATCWLAARLFFLWMPWHWSALLANMLFALILLRFAALPFLRTARKWRNQAIVPLLTLLALMPLPVFMLANGDSGPHIARQWVVGFALLMLFMGGRIMAPAFAGAIRKRGGRLQGPVQPVVEANILLITGAALLLGLLALRVPAGLLLLTAAVLALVRFLRWQPWRVIDRADYIGLGLGYLWLVGGVAAMATPQILDRPPSSATLHLITVGALGSLTVTVMARTWCQKLGLGAPPGEVLWLLLGLVTAATLLRVLGGPGHWLWAAGCWSAAYLGLLGLFLSTAHKARRQREAKEQCEVSDA